jgi:hypothetical protein
MMTKPITRRGLLAVAAALPAASQQPVPIPATAPEETASVQSQLQSDFEQLRKVRLPIGTEPATRFRA